MGNNQRWAYYAEEAGPNPIREVLRILLGVDPPSYVLGYDTNCSNEREREMLQNWVGGYTRPSWSTNIGILEAAEHIVQEAVSNGNIPPPEYWVEKAREDREAAEARAARKPRKRLPRCSVCREIQRSTPSGPACKNGHGGAPSI